MNSQTTEISTESISSETRNILPEIRTQSYQLEPDNSDEDIVQAHDDAGSTNQFIAEGLHEIASTANKVVLLGEGEDMVREEVPDWHARLQAFKEISDHKGLRGRKEQKKKKREGSVYVFVQ